MYIPIFVCWFGSGAKCEDSGRSSRFYFSFGAFRDEQIKCTISDGCGHAHNDQFHQINKCYEVITNTPKALFFHIDGVRVLIADFSEVRLQIGTS
jgi:hypothetical protein